MSISQPDAQRRLLPRWQPSDATIAAGELVTTGSRSRAPLEDAHFEERKLEWERDRSIEVAAELVASGIVLNRTVEVEPAARLLADHLSDVSPTLRELAQRALGAPVTTPSGTFSRRPGRLDPTSLYAGISALRRHAHQHPRDAYAWIDLARLYTILGQNAKAQHAIDIALALAPEDRFVLRATARFFVHIDKPDIAQRQLLQARATTSDPWLIAAEIAVSQVAQRRSQTASLGQRALKQNQWSPRSTSELAGSVATLLLEDGSTQKARQLFRTSLEDPTENAIAQAQWATQRTSGLFVPAKLLEQPTTYEARALRERTEGRWDEAIASSWNWAEYEPTSTRSLIMGSYVAAVAFGDGTAVLEFTDRGLCAEPHNIMLLNNKAVGLAYLGRVADSVEVLRPVVIESSPQISQPALYATAGLLRFRLGEVEKGRQLYEKALGLPYARRDPGVRILALWHLAIEENRARTEQAEAAVARAERASKDVKLAEVDALRKRLAEAKASAVAMAAGASRISNL